MKLTDFKKRIDRAEKMLGRKSFDGNYYVDGICCVLSGYVSFCARSHFQKYFAPRKPRDPYWLGTRDASIGRSNLNKRKVYLRMFEQIAISEKWYKNYEGR